MKRLVPRRFTEPMTLTEIAAGGGDVKRLARGAMNWENDGRHLRPSVAEMVRNGGSCFVCGKAFLTARDAQIDHDHKTGSVRGILCRDCNMGLGCFRDDPELVARAWYYLSMEDDDPQEWLR